MSSQDWTNFQRFPELPLNQNVCFVYKKICQRNILDVKGGNRYKSIIALSNPTQLFAPEYDIRKHFDTNKCPDIYLYQNKLQATLVLTR